MPPREVRTSFHRRRFRRRPEAVAAVRRFVGGALTRGSEPWETTRLLVSETVTSALDQPGGGHHEGTFEVGYTVDGDRMVVEVSDDGGPARLRRRVQRAQGVRGRGMDLVRVLSRRWGVRESVSGRTIWFEVDVGDRR
jgi:anti-sigma regulatory factor (Ser/Thr protein kinase)